MLDAFISMRLAPSLKKRGFLRSGLRWHLRGAGVWGMIALQKHPDNAGDRCAFTVNLEVTSDRLRYFDGEAVPLPRPRLGEPTSIGCRLGFLLESPRDRWWTFDAGCDPRVIEDQVESGIAGPGLTYLRLLRSDVAIRDHWLAQNITTGRQAIHLAVLLHDLGPREMLPALMNSVRLDVRSRRWDYCEALLHRISNQDRSVLPV
jgi:hypothetical protein